MRAMIKVAALPSAPKYTCTTAQTEREHQEAMQKQEMQEIRKEMDKCQIVQIDLSHMSAQEFVRACRQRYESEATPAIWVETHPKEEYTEQDIMSWARACDLLDGSENNAYRKLDEGCYRKKTRVYAQEAG